MDLLTQAQKKGSLLLLGLLFLISGIRTWWEERPPRQAPRLPATWHSQLANTAPKAAPDTLRLDLNVATAEELMQLPGIGPVLSERILRFRESLGGFRQVSQLRKVYGLSAETYERIESKLLLSPGSSPRKTPRQKVRKKPNKPASSPISPPPPPTLDLNQADSASLEALPGIGPVLAKRILKYRSLIGHFVAVEQLQIVYGLSPENYQRMRPHLKALVPDSIKIKDLNAEKTYRLAWYLGKENAQQLSQHRKQLGWFESWEQVAACPGVDSARLSWLKRYFKLK
jgi:competence protein ComEA